MSVFREPGELERFTLSIAFVTRLYTNYRATKVSEVISEHDDMYNSNMSDPMRHYMAVGLSAVHAICGALITVGKCSVGKGEYECPVLGFADNRV